MAETQILATKIASIIIFAIIGYILQKNNTLGKDGKSVVSNLINRIGLPFLILVSYISIKIDFSLFKNIFIVIGFAVFVIFLNYLYSSFIAKKHNMEDSTASVFITGSAHGNTAFLAFALLYAVYGNEGLFYATMYYLVDNIIFIISGLSRLRKNSSEKTKVPPVTITLIIALFLMIFLSIFNLDVTNNFVFSAMNDVANLTTPLAFMFIGMAIYGSNFKEILTNKDAINLVIVKMLIIPLIVIGILFLLKLDLNIIVAMVIITQAGMPPLSALMSFAYEYKQNVKFASSLVIIGHFFAIISVPVIFSIGLLLFK